MTELLLSSQSKKVLKNYKLTSHDRSIKLFPQIFRSQENKKISITNMMIETHHSNKRYYNFFEVTNLRRL